MKQLPLAAVCGVGLIGLFTTSPLLAEEADPIEIVITADRKARTVDETLAPVTIITRQDIEKYQASNLAEVLQHAPGVSIMNQGGSGKLTSLFLRGTESDHVLVLIDGVKVGSVTDGRFAFEDIPPESIERIEVVRGPRSTLYGSEAIGGVIQIFTRKGGKGFQPEVKLSAGSHNTQKLSANLGGGDEQRWFNIGASTEKTDGYNACTGNSATFAGCAVEEPDDDGYENQTFTLRAGRKLGENTKLDISALHSSGDNEFDGSAFSGNHNDKVQQVLSATLQTSPTANSHYTLRAGQSRDKLTNDKDGTFVSQYETRRNTASLQTDLQLTEAQSVTAGVDYQDEKLLTSESYQGTSRNTVGVFAQYQLERGTNSLQLAARHEDDEQFGGHNTGNIAFGHELANGMNVTASYGTAFKAPTFNELYNPWGGNPDLKPEKSASAELGIKGRFNHGEWAANAYHTDVDDLISIWPIDNIDQASISGLETTASLQLADWTTTTSLTLQNPRNKAGTNDGNLLPRRAQQILQIDADRTFGRASAGASLHAEGKRYDDAANLNKLPGYATLDLRTSYALNKNWTLGGKLGNVFNKSYETAQYYQQDGRNVLVDLRYAPR